MELPSLMNLLSGLTLTDWGIITTIVVSLITLIITIRRELKNRQMDKADVKIDVIKNVFNKDKEPKILENYINVKNKGGLDTTLEKIYLIINSGSVFSGGLLKDNCTLFKTEIIQGQLGISEHLSLPYPLSKTSSLPILIQTEFFPTENINVIKEVEIKIKHTYGEISKKISLSHKSPFNQI